MRNTIQTLIKNFILRKLYKRNPRSMSDKETILNIMKEEFTDVFAYDNSRYYINDFYDIKNIWSKEVTSAIMMNVNIAITQRFNTVIDYMTIK